MLFFKTGREVHGPEHRLIMIILLRDLCDQDFPGKTRLLSKRIVDNYFAFSLLCTKLLGNLNNTSGKNKLHGKFGLQIFGFCNTFERCSSHQGGEAAWPTGWRLGLAMWWSWVLVPL